MKSVKVTLQLQQFATKCTSFPSKYSKASAFVQKKVKIKWFYQANFVEVNKISSFCIIVKVETGRHLLKFSLM